MDGRLLVLCDEEVTLNSYNQRVDKEGNILKKIQEGLYEDKELNKVEVDEHKNIISAIDLIMPQETESIEKRDILFVNWDTIIPEDIGYLQELVRYSTTTEQLSSEMIIEGLKQKDSIMKRAHEDSFKAIQDERPSMDYRFIAMEQFMRTLQDMMDSTMIVRVLPAYRIDSSVEIKKARQKVIDSFNYRNDTFSKTGRESRIDILAPMEYEEFGQVYIRAQDEMLKILSAPDWYDNPAPKPSKTEIGDR